MTCVCQFMQCHLESHWKFVEHILCYLKGTVECGIWFRQAKYFTLEAFSYADWASDLDDRKPTTRYSIYFGPNLIIWSAKKQIIVSRSSIEVEFRSLASVATKVTWVH